MVLAHVEEAGGKVAMPKTEITPEFGSPGAFLETEGKGTGLHAPM